MAIPKKGSRGIRVDGVDYRWSVRRKPTYCQGLCHTPLNVAVALAREPGTVAVLRMRDPHPSNWMGAPAVEVRPAVVALGIRTALERGWSPKEPGRPLVAEMASLAHARVTGLLIRSSTEIGRRRP